MGSMSKLNLLEVESEEKKRVVHDPRRVVRYSFAESIRHEREFESDREPEVYLTNFEEVLEGEIQRAKSAERRKQMTIRRWFKQPQLYQVSFPTTPNPSTPWLGLEYLRDGRDYVTLCKCLLRRASSLCRPFTTELVFDLIFQALWSILKVKKITIFFR